VRLTAEALRAATGGAVGNLALFDTVDSTHQAALHLIDQATDEELCPSPTLIIARRQNAGQGRDGRSWVSPEGGLYMTFVSAQVSRETVPLLPMLAAVGLHNALISLGVTGAGIKWPNDILIEGGKVAGILAHVRHSTPLWVVVSAGVNLSAVPEVDDEPPHPPTALSEHLPERPWDEWAPVLAGGFVRALAGGARRQAALLETWRSNLVHRPGDELTVRLSSGREHRGRYLGLTEECHLRLDCDGEEKAVTSGDVFGA
jgi:BirA family biotin operon repressor/biotin-[acetyl-CoA-carboxylase] ligase